MIKSEGFNTNNGKQAKQTRGRRGSNFTNIEKQILIQLTDEFKDIIESKETHSSWINKKRDTWKEIAHRYNAAESSGARTWQQIRHWYDNHKQSARRAMIRNPNDNECYPTVKSEPYGLYIRIEDQDSSQQSTSNEQIMDEYNEQDAATRTPDAIDDQYYQQSTADYSIAQNRQNHKVESMQNLFYEQSPESYSNNQSRDNPRVESLKEKYYREKLKNARLERQLLVTRNKIEIIKHRKEMEILRVKLKILQGRRRW